MVLQDELEVDVQHGKKPFEEQERDFILRQLLKIALQVICEFLLEKFLVSFDPSQRDMRLKKKQKQKDFGKKYNVAIKRVKSNA